MFIYVFILSSYVFVYHAYGKSKIMKQLNVHTALHKQIRSYNGWVSTHPSFLSCRLSMLIMS